MLLLKCAYHYVIYGATSHAMTTTSRPKPPPAAPKKVSLTEQAYAKIKEQILDQRLEPGARLNIDALSRQLNVSSSPIREALARLEAERLVVSAANTGYSVTPSPTPQFLRDLMEYRAVTEGYCASIGAAIGAPEVRSALEKVEKAMRSMRKLGPRFREYREYTDLDSQFHQIIVDSARNEVLSTTYRSMHAVLTGARMSLFREAGTISSDDAVSEHADILAAYAARDGKRAEAAVRAHLQGSLTRMLNSLQRSHGLANETMPRWAGPAAQ